MRVKVAQLASALLGFFLCGLGTLSYSAPNGVELALRCQESAGTTLFRITWRNTGSTNTQIVLGINVGWGQRYDATSFVLDVKRDGNSAVEEFHPETGAFIAGPAGPWLVPLPSMSEYSLLLPISKFWSPPSLERLKIRGSAIDVRLHYVAPEHWLGGETPSANRRNVFAGELATEWLRVPDQCH